MPVTGYWVVAMLTTADSPSAVNVTSWFPESEVSTNAPVQEKFVPSKLADGGSPLAVTLRGSRGGRR